jgi:hypothetical protein
MIVGFGISSHNEGCGPQGRCRVNVSICHTEGFGLLLAKLWKSIAALTSCKQKHPIKLSAYID